MIGVALLAQLAVVLPIASAPPHANEVSTRSQLETRELQFLIALGDAYRLSQTNGQFHRLNLSSTIGQLYVTNHTTRQTFWHCHFTPAGSTSDIEAPAKYVISSIGNVPVSVCPSWRFDEDTVIDESRSPNSALDARFAAFVDSARRSLIAALDSAALAFPSDGWIAGQRVRLLVDQRDMSGALRAADECRSDKWWCRMLRAFVQAEGNDTQAAARGFTEALALMPPATRCAWTAIDLLLPEEERASFARASCEQQARLAQLFWWIGDPFWMRPGNERKVEHFRRLVMVKLRAAVGRDEHFHWNPEMGGDAVATMLIRYGWPSFMYWAGFTGDLVHNNYVLHGGGTPRQPYSTYEYLPANRISSLLSLSKVESPFTLKAGDWVLHGPTARTWRMLDEATDATAARQLINSRLPRADSALRDQLRMESALWWPREHYQASRPVRQLDPSIAFLRRQDSIVVATSSALGDTSTLASARDSVRSFLFISSAPDSISLVATRQSLVAGWLAIFGAIRPSAGLLGVECEGAREQCRARVGIAPPRPLSALEPNEIAISDPVLFNPTNPSIHESERRPESVLLNMLPTYSVSTNRPVGVYWESYGVSPADSVRVAVGVQRQSRSGVLRRIGVALNVVPDDDTPIHLAWSSTGGDAHLVSGAPVAIVARTIVLNAATLSPGDYWLEVVVAPKGREPVRARRAIRVEK